MPPATAARADDLSYLAGLVREFDRPRYYATLFAPEPLRAELLALYGFAAEIERIPGQVRDPMLGRIRQQWWRDALEPGAGEDGGDADAPALRAVLSLAERHRLSLEPLRAFIDAHAATLFLAATPGPAEAEVFLGETQSALFRLAAALAGAEGPAVAEAAHRAGLAYGLARRLAEPKPGQHEDIAALTERARDHLRIARAAGWPRRALPVFLPLAVVEPMLARAGQAGPAISEPGTDLSDLETLLRISWARLSGRP